MKIFVHTFKNCIILWPLWGAVFKWFQHWGLFLMQMSCMTAIQQYVFKHSNLSSPAAQAVTGICWWICPWWWWPAAGTVWSKTALSQSSQRDEIFLGNLRRLNLIVVIEPAIVAPWETIPTPWSWFSQHLSRNCRESGFLQSLLGVFLPALGLVLLVKLGFAPGELVSRVFVLIVSEVSVLTNIVSLGYGSSLSVVMTSSRQGNRTCTVHNVILYRNPQKLLHKIYNVSVNIM